MIPKNAADCHFHVFESTDRYPQRSAARYEIPLATLDEYLRLCKEDGIERYVFVQPSAYATDNSCMLDAMARVDPKLRRGVVGLDRTVTDEQLADLHERGVRGVRINVSPVAKFDRSLPARISAEAIEMGYRIRELGWHLDFLGPGWLTTALIPMFRALPLDFSVAHMGMFLTSKGTDQPGFEEFLDLLVYGRGWAKFTGIYRMSQLPDFADVAPHARAIIAKNADRIIWGSDWPHISFSDKTTNAQELQLLQGWCDNDPALLQKILVDNPSKFYGF